MPVFGLGCAGGATGLAVAIAVLPLAFGLVGYAIVFTLLNAVMMGVRIRSEAGALSAATSPRTAD